MGMPNLGIMLGSGMNQYLKMQQADKEDAFKQQQIDLQKEANQRANDLFALQKGAYEKQDAREEAKYKANQQFGQTLADANAMETLPGDLRQRVASGELTQDEANNALKAYQSAGYTPTGLRSKATLAIAAEDPVKAMQVKKELHEEARRNLMERASPFLAKKDYTGLANLFSDNSFYNDGNQYSFVGQQKGKDGRTYIGYAMKDANGKTLGQPQWVDEEMIPGFVEASLDPTKGLEYSKNVIAQRRADQQHEDMMKRLGILAANGAARTQRAKLDSPMAIQNFALRLTHQFERENRNDPVAAGITGRISGEVGKLLGNFKPGTDAELAAINADKTRNDILDRYRSVVGDYSKYKNYIESEDVIDPKSLEKELTQTVLNQVQAGWKDAEIRHAAAASGLTIPAKQEKGSTEVPKLNTNIAAKNAAIIDRALARARSATTANGGSGTGERDYSGIWK